MKRLYIVVEGQTEQEFVNEILRPYLNSYEIYDVTPVPVHTSSRFLYQFPQIPVVGNGEGRMCIAAQYHGNAVLTAQAQNLHVIGPGLHLSSRGDKAAVVYLQQRPVLPCRQHYGFKVQFCRTVAGVRDYLHPWIAHHVYHALRVLLACPKTRKSFKYLEYQLG